MKVLFVVQPLDGDRPTKDRVRVELHHSEGLSNTQCLVNDEVREVRCTSALDSYHPVTKTRTIVVHLKPVPPRFAMRLRCSMLSSKLMLMSVRDKNSWPSLDEYGPKNLPPRLARRKASTLIRKGYVRTEKGVPFITEKGLSRLES